MDDWPRGGGRVRLRNDYSLGGKELQTGNVMIDGLDKSYAVCSLDYNYDGHTQQSYEVINPFPASYLSR